MSDHFSNLPYAKARLALISAQSNSLELAHSLRGAGYEICSDNAPSQGIIHLLIVDLRVSPEAFTIATTHMKAVRKYVTNGGLIFIAPTSIAPEARAGLARLGDILTCPTPQTLISVVSQKLRARALAEGTLLKVRSLCQFNAPKTFLDACWPSEIAEQPEILLAGSPSPTILAAASALRTAGYRFECVFSAGQALRSVLAKKFDAAVFVPSSDHDPLFALSRHLLRSRRRSLPPVVFVGDTDWVVKRTYSDAVSLVNLECELGYRVQRSVGEAKARQTLAKIHSMRQYSADWGADRATYGLAFCANYARSLFRVSDVQKTAVSLMVLRLPANLAISSVPEVTRTITRSLRTIDLPCAISPDTVLVISPGLTNSDAHKVARRLERLLSNNVRYGSEAQSPACAAATQIPGERFEETLAQALHAIRSAKKRPTAHS